MPNKYFLMIFSIFLMSCSSKKILDTHRHDKLFPDGVYRQRIELEILKQNSVTAGFPFTSVSRVENGKFEILGLSPFGTSVFEASGHIDNPDDLIIKFFIKPPAFLKKQFIKDTFVQISNLYNLKESDLTKKEDRDYFKSNDLELEIFKYNSQSIPSALKMTAKKWRVYVKTQNYKDLN